MSLPYKLGSTSDSYTPTYTNEYKLPVLISANASQAVDLGQPSFVAGLVTDSSEAIPAHQMRFWQSHKSMQLLGQPGLLRA